VAMLTPCQESRLHLLCFLLLLAILFWSSASSAQTRVHSNQINPYGGRDAYRYVSSRGNDSNDGLSPGNAYATPQKCNSVVTGLGGGTCDMRSLYSYTSSTEIDCGNLSSVPVVCLLPPYGIWLSNVSDGVSFGFKVFNNASAISQGISYTEFAIQSGPTANMAALCGNDSSVADEHIRMEGFACDIFSGTATMAKSVGYFSGMSDGSHIDNMSFEDLSSTNVTKVFWANNDCCSMVFHNIVADAYAVPAVTPCWFGDGTTGPNLAIEVDGISCTHPGGGASVLVDQEDNQFSTNVFKNVYMEMCPTGCFASFTDTTTAWISVQTFGTPLAADLFLGVKAGGDLTASTRYTLDIASGAHATIIGASQGNISMNAVNDHNSPVHTKTAPVNSTFSYSTEIANWINGAPSTRTIASGTATMTTAAIAAGACGATVTGTFVTGSAADILSSDSIIWSFNAAPAANPAAIPISTWPVAATSVNFRYCIPVGATGMTPNAATLNWSVVR
jgi:hypothetical protein